MGYEIGGAIRRARCVQVLIVGRLVQVVLVVGQVAGVGMVVEGVVALAFALNDQAEDADGHLEHSGQVHVIVDGQQVAVFVRVANVELDAVEAVQTFEHLVKVFEFGDGVTVETEPAKLSIVLLWREQINKSFF